MAAPNLNDELSLLVEIVSCRDILVGDRTTSDAYVKLHLGTKELHKTKHVLKTLNPVFGAEHNNVCVINVKYEDLLNAGGLHLEVKDWDRVGTNDPLGDAIVDTKTLIAGAGTVELAITPPKKRKETSAGYITVRVTHATDADRANHVNATPTTASTFWTPAQEEEAAEEPTLESEPPVVVTKEMAEPEPTPEPEPEPTPEPAPAAVPEPEPEPVVDISPTESIEFAIDIVSCKNLLAADRTGTSDPYIKIHLGTKELHKTKHIHKTLNPVYDKETKGSFVLKCKGADLTNANGLELEVKDWDRGLGGNDPLGKAKISAAMLYSKATSRDGNHTIDLKITPPPGKEGQDAGYVTLRAQTVTMSGATDRAISAAAAAEDEDVPVPTEDKSILLEILSCRDLIAADKTGLSDPYVKIKMGSKDLHRTGHVEKTLNPAYNAEFSNVYILQAKAKELFAAKGIELEVKDWDRGIGKNDSLGYVKIPASTLYNTVHDEGESMELELNPPKGHGEKAGFIKFKIREPTLGDKEDFKSKTSLRGKLASKVVPKLGGKKEEKRDTTVSATNSIDLLDKEDKIFLIEILSCRDLLAGDKGGTSDPYVKVKFDGKDIHKTKHVLKTLNPEFTEEAHNNTFVLDKSVMELFSKNGILLKIKDWDRGIGGDDDLGTVQIPANDLYELGGQGLEKEYGIDPPSGKSDAAGFATIRCTTISAAERDARKSGGIFSRLTGKSTVVETTRDLDFSDLSLLVEIVSCQNLVQSAMDAADAYVKVQMGDKEVHKTQRIDDNQNPIYTLKHGSLFIVNVVKEEFSAEKEALTFIVKDYDAVGKNDELGFVHVSGETLCKANGERMVLKLNPKAGSKHTDAGVINIRCRPATNYDKKFLEYANGDQKGDFLGVGSNMDIVLKTKGGSKELFKGKLKMDDEGVTKYRIRPEPDPERPSVTKWMSDAEIQAKALEASRRWISIGSGTVGRLYVEVIGADGLPNLDASVTGRDKSDCFAMIVYEDGCAKTDIIDDCLSPRWLPWMQRAFVLNMDHTSSDVFIGVFDYDGGIGGTHDIIGRFAVETSTLRPGTEYVMTYNLYQDSVTKDRQANGNLTVRLRMECDSQKQLVLSNLRPPPQQYINVRKKKDFHLVRQVVQGKTDLQSYSLNTVMLYVEELTSYLYVQYYIMDAAISLLFWRGQVPVFGFKLPIHSLIAFIAAITMAERPTLYFSYFWFGNAWLLLAIQNWQNNTPNPWSRSRGFGAILRMMILNTAMSGPETIPANHKEQEANEFEAEMEERIKKAEAAAEKRREEEMKILAEHEKEVAELDQTAETDISTKTSGVSLGPMAMLKPFLYPVQQNLALVCYGLRVVRNVYTWEEPYFAFLLAAASMVIGSVFYFVPWAFLIRWTGRIIAWVVFGPHMKLVDLFYFSKLGEATADDEKKALEVYYKAQKELAEQNALLARIQTEDAVKLKEIKKVMYGKFICNVPVIKGERFRDVPLHKSYSHPYEPAKDAPPIDPISIGGQGLVGNMIPKLRTLDNAKKEKSANEEADADAKAPLLK